MSYLSYRPLALILVSSIAASCGKAKTPINAFTTKLVAESSLQTVVHIPNAHAVASASGLNIVNAPIENISIPANEQLYLAKYAKLTDAEVISVPAISSDGKAFFVDSRNILHCYDLAQKKALWTSKLSLYSSNSPVLAGVTLHGDRLYVNNNSTHVIIVDKNSGHEISRIALPDMVMQPVLVDEKNIYVISSTNQVFAFNKNTLLLSWQVAGLEDDNTVTFTRGSITPVDLGSSILASFQSGRFFNIDKSSGKVIWDLATVQNRLSPYDVLLYKEYLYTNPKTQPVIRKGTAILTGPSYLAAVDLKNAKEKWQIEAEDILALNQFGNLIVLANNADQVAGVDAVSGKVLWTVDLAGQKDQTTDIPPLMINGVIQIVGAKGKLYSISTSGEIIKVEQAPKEARFAAVYKDKMYVFAKGEVWRNK